MNQLFNKNFYKFLIAFVVLLGISFLVEHFNLRVDSKKLTGLLPIEENLGDNIGAYFWAGKFDAGNKDFLSTGDKLLKDVGTRNIRITMTPSSDADYNVGGCISSFSLKNLASRQDFNSILSDPSYKTVMITAIDGTSFQNCSNKSYLNPSFYTQGNTQRIQQEYRDFASYLAKFSDKTFIISNWEGDNDVYCGAAYGATVASCPDYAGRLGGFKKWIEVRTSGIKASGASNVFSAVEFNIVNNLKSRNLPSVLYDVIPELNVDYFSYSSYESINALYNGDDGSQLKKDVATIRGVLSSAGQDPNNLVIGEYGFDRGGREEIKNKLATVTQIIGELGIKYGFVWNLLDAGGQFGLYDSSATLTPAGQYFCEIWNGDACSSHPDGGVLKLNLTNISDQSRNSSFYNIDSWKLDLTGASPNSAVKICGNQNNQGPSCTPVESLGFGAATSTDGNGSWSLENSWTGWDDKSINGSWEEWLEVGGIKSNVVKFSVSSPVANSQNVFYIPESDRTVGDNGTGYKAGSTEALFGNSVIKVEDKLNVLGGTPPYSWSVARGDLPKGLSLKSDGTVSGQVGAVLNIKFAKTANAEVTPSPGFGAVVVDSRGQRAVANIKFSGNIAAIGATGGLVTCGRTGQAPCTTCDLLVLMSNIINFILFILTPAIATLLYLVSGFMILMGGANPALISQGRNIFKNVTYALFIIFGSWMITNSVLKSIAGDSLFTKDWNKVTCNAPAAENPEQKYSCNSSNQCVADVNGQYSTSYCGNQCNPVNGGDNCSDSSALAKKYNVPYPARNAPELDQLINCVKGKLPGQDLGSVFTYDNSHPSCNYTRGNRTCDSSCSHAVNSCHYGGATGSQGSLAVDFGNEKNGDKIIQAANACGAKSGGARCENSSGTNVACSDASADHVHVTAGSCDRN